MSYRFFLGTPSADSGGDSVGYDEVASSGSELRRLSAGYTEPFKMRIAPGVDWVEVEAFFADGERPQPEDFWAIYLPHRGLEHPTMDELRAALGARKAVR